jgi:5-methylcytosine-specific restriction protein A
LIACFQAKSTTKQTMRAAPRPCTHPSCGALVRDGSGRCAKHIKQQRQAIDERRGTSAERGYSYAWQQARAGFLRKHPLCASHEKKGEVVAATVVDHIDPHKGDKAKFWERTNWQPLCKPCHDRKTVIEDGGFGRWRG